MCMQPDARAHHLQSNGVEIGSWEGGGAEV